MTTSDEFSLLAEAPKDRWGRYKISDPASGKERGYTRVTTIAKVLDDSSSLADWKTRMAITGIVQRADLLAQASTALDDRSKLNKIANDAIDAAGAYSRANLGTALHSITQQLDLGMKPQILQGLQADIETYVASIAAWDFGMRKEWIEVLLINDEYEYAGTADRIVTTRDGKICIFDLKTGTDLSYSYGSISVQLAMYANADWIYDWKTGERTALPEGLDMKEGIICHLPAGEADCKFYTVDLEAGWEAAKMSFATRNWRKRKDLFKPYQFSDEKRRVVEPVANPMPQGDDSVSPKELQIRQEWMKQRIANLTPLAQGMLKICWPDGCPKLQETSPEQLQQLVKVIEAVEAEHDIPFFEADPIVKKPAKRKSKTFDTANWQHPMNAIEGRDLDQPGDEQAVTYIRERLNGIQGADRARMAMLITQAELAGRSISLKETKSLRRFEIARGLFLLFDSGQFDEDLVKDICSQITSQKYTKPGEALANLDVKQAQRFANACHGIARDLLNLIYIPETNQFHIEEQAS